MLTARAEKLLAWYDRNARTMPWRVGPADRAAGVRPDPYRVWLSEVMLQQTTVATVGAYFEKFTRRWPAVTDLAAADRDEVLSMWAGLGYYARARNLHRCAGIVAEELEGRFPRTEAELLRLPGIGAYTAAAIAAICFDERAVVVDGNVERVIARLSAVEDPMPGSKPALKALAGQATPDNRAGDYAQAMMDLGATVCSVAKPRCEACPLSGFCEGKARGIAADLPRRSPKKVKPTRYGVAYLARRADGAVLLMRRPDEGLLGGMAGLPGAQWTTDPEPAGVPPLAADWRDEGVEVRHTFTHFHLRLRVLSATWPEARAPAGGWFSAPEDLADEALPTLYRKALRAAGVAVKNGKAP